MLIDFAKLDSTDRYKIMSTAISPRPIAWIVTEDDGVVNIAPFSYFTPLSSKPATVVVSIGHKKDGTPKDTLANILKTKRATICLVNAESLEKMELSSDALDKGESEAEKFDITTDKVKAKYPPMIQSSDCAIFCDFLQKIDLEESKTIPLILEIKACHINHDLVDDNFNIELDNIARVGKNYATLDMI
jgi:flavin reductase (DIM6/NTAB) family NADH-FMN oxidoreductase RutF